jgi:ferredoxin
MSYLVEIDDAACAAHGDCVDIAPQIFALEECAVVIGAGPDELALTAAEACPSTAIRLVDMDTGDQVYP